MFICTSAYDKVIPSRGREMVPTDVVVAMPAGTYGRIAPRSGLALKNGIDVGAGVIDPDYRGNVGILLFNFSDTDFTGFIFYFTYCLIFPNLSFISSLSLKPHKFNYNAWFHFFTYCCLLFSNLSLINCINLIIYLI